jgi:hypothetical protein
MAIGEQFAGLDMEKLIGGPLNAAANASIALARSTADFINTVGFNADKSARTVMFKFQKSDSDLLGNPIKSEMQIDVPMLAIVPIPNLQIDEVNILFDMEVKECEKAESSLDAGGSFSLAVGWGPVKVNISGNVSVHQSNTRSSDNSAKYHVDVRATNHGMPEGLARVMDIMAASAAPTLLSSKIVDENGQEVNGEAKEKRLALQESYAAQQQLGSSCKAASEEFDSSIKRLQDLITLRNNAEKLKIQEKLNTITEGANETQTAANDDLRTNYTNILQNVHNSWTRVSQELRTTVEALYNPEANVQDDTSAMTALFDMKKVTESGNIITIEKITNTTDISTMQNGFKSAVKNFAALKAQEKSLADERAKYNTLLMKR